MVRVTNARLGVRVNFRSGLLVGVLLVALGLVARVVDLSGQASSQRVAAAEPCACAGHVWRGHTTSVSATITVPSVAANKAGRAATWIGAEALRDLSVQGTPLNPAGLAVDTLEGSRSVA